MRTDIINRRNKIIELVRSRDILRIADAVNIFNVSDETIRKDFAILENKGIIKKVHGGAVFNESDIVKPVETRSTENYDSKLKIALRAAEFIPESHCIIGLDMGSTVAILSTLISKMSGKSIVTNSIPSAHELLKSDNDLFITGGHYRGHDMSMQGDWAINALKTIAMDVCFLGSSGVSNRQGICSTGFYDTEIKKEYIKRSAKTIVLIDSSKFSKSSLVEVARWESVDIVITDSDIDEHEREKLSKIVELITA